MIKFISKPIETGSTISFLKSNIDNMIYTNTTSQLNEMFKDNCCRDHPEFDNTVTVEFVDNKPVMTIQSYCCENYKKTTLEFVISNRKPPID